MPMLLRKLVFLGLLATIIVLGGVANATSFSPNRQGTVSELIAVAASPSLESLLVAQGEDVPQCRDISTDGYSHTLEPQPLSVLLFIDESRSSYWESDPRTGTQTPFRGETAHLIVDYLFADGQLRCQHRVYKSPKHRVKKSPK